VAQNLMVPCYMSSSDIHSLASLLNGDHDWLSGTSLIIAGSGMELLVAQADRIIRLQNHEVKDQSVTAYREGLVNHFEKIQKMIPKNGSGKSDIGK
jgi:uncharacterized protein